MWEEFDSAGGIKFFSKTEELLRLAEFEEALLRYRFLKGQVAGLAAYRPLVLDIDRRLHFLQRQLRLSEADIQALPRLRLRSGSRARAPETIPPPKPKTEVTTILESGPASPSATPQDTPPPIPPIIIPTPTMTQKSPQPTTSPTEAPAPGPESTTPEPQADASPEGTETPTPTPAPPQKSFLGWLKSFF